MTPANQRAFVTALIGLGLVIVGFFGFRTLHAFREFRAHRPHPPFKTEQPETDVELIRDWMTIPFVARMYHVRPPEIFDALQVPSKGNEEKSIEQLNDEYFPDQPGLLLQMVKAAVQARIPPPTAIPPATAVPPVTPLSPVSP